MTLRTICHALMMPVVVIAAIMYGETVDGERVSVYWRKSDVVYRKDMQRSLGASLMTMQATNKFLNSIRVVHGDDVDVDKETDNEIEDEDHRPLFTLGERLSKGSVSAARGKPVALGRQPPTRLSRDVARRSVSRARRKFHASKLLAKSVGAQHLTDDSQLSGTSMKKRRAFWDSKKLSKSTRARELAVEPGMKEEEASEISRPKQRRAFWDSKKLSNSTRARELAVEPGMKEEEASEINRPKQRRAFWDSKKLSKSTRARELAVEPDIKEEEASEMNREKSSRWLGLEDFRF